MRLLLPPVCRRTRGRIAVVLAVLTVVSAHGARAWTPTAEPGSVAALAAGFAGGLAAHETAHLLAVRSTGNRARWDGLSIVYDTDRMSGREHLWSASAGTLAQWALTEGVFAASGKEGPGDFGAGVVLSEVLTAAAYVTILYSHPEGDVQGIANASGVGRGWIAAGMALPAALDAWRLFAGEPPPAWVPTAALFAKGAGFVWVLSL